jgi:hypothetical protein
VDAQLGRQLGLRDGGVDPQSFHQLDQRSYESEWIVRPTPPVVYLKLLST